MSTAAPTARYFVPRNEFGKKSWFVIISVCQFVGPDKASRTTPHRAPPPRSRRMPAVDFWDHPPDPPSAASVDGVASPAPRVVLVPVDDSDHAQRAVAWAVDNLLRGGDGGDVAHLLHVVPAVHAATAMAYGGPPVWMEDLSTFSKSLYAVTAIPPAAISYPPRSLLGRFFSDALVVAFYRLRQKTR